MAWSRHGERPAARARRGEQLELEIESLAFGGGRARGWLRGLRLRRRCRGPGARRGTKTKRASPRPGGRAAASPRRPGPERCVHEGEPCPGAPWQGLPYEGQLAHKRDQVNDALRRIGGLDDFELEEIEPAGEQWRYRNKLEYSFGEREGEPVLGFHARGRWDRIVDVEDCRSPPRRSTRSATSARLGPRGGVPPTTARAGRRPAQPGRPGGSAHRPDPDPSRHLAGQFPKPRSISTLIEGDAGGTDGPTGALGEERLREELCGLRLEMSHGAFFQTNTEMAERLYGIAAEFAGLTGTERVFDLYCGIGTIGLAMAAQRRRGMGVGDRPRGDRRRRANAERNGIANARFIAGRRPHRGPPAARGGGQARRRRRRPAPRRALEEDRQAGDRVRGEADRLRLLQPDHARPQRRPARRGRL